MVSLLQKRWITYRNTFPCGIAVKALPTSGCAGYAGSNTDEGEIVPEP